MMLVPNGSVWVLQELKIPGGAGKVALGRVGFRGQLLLAAFTSVKTFSGAGQNTDTGHKVKSEVLFYV